MEQDRELLERAAKVASLWDYRNNCIDVPWGPLVSGGDALDLAVKLRLAIVPHETEVAVHHRESEYTAVEPYGNDPNAATRRAIVRCAASLAPV